MTWVDVRTFTPAEQFEAVKLLRDELRNGYSPAFVPAQETEDGLIEMGWICYPDWLWDGVWCGIYLAEHLGAAWERIEGYEHIEDLRTVSTLDFGDVYSWFTAYGCKERLCDGYLAKGAENGALLALAERYVAIVEGTREYVSAIEEGDAGKRRE
ncbi:DUF6508 domain-containing protein [Corynebacterium sp. UBA2622]|uniref:DUF6508 domain-containing protein n=1 Tax=Corynebacterium sp. UBA2622 TaxID=1946393 RepID=UPI0025BE9F73|nr:hypothetical protein [Corynebacterium sp. UBA2622]